jgi:hypothetical protein
VVQLNVRGLTAGEKLRVSRVVTLPWEYSRDALAPHFFDCIEDAMAARLAVRRDYLAVLMRLSYLSPEIIRAIAAGEQPIELAPTRLVALSRNLPHDWQEQRRLLGFSPA